MIILNSGKSDLDTVSRILQEGKFQGPQAQIEQYQIPQQMDDSFMLDPPSDQTPPQSRRLDSFRIKGGVRHSNPDGHQVKQQAEKFMSRKSINEAAQNSNDMIIQYKGRGSKTLDIGSNYTMNRTDNLISTFLRLVMAKSYQTNFIQNLMNKSYIKNLSHLTNYQISIVDDLILEDDFDEDTENQDCSYSIQKRLKEISKLPIFISISTCLNKIKIPVLEPESNFMLFWDLFQIIIILLIFLWIPFKISFNFNYISNLFQPQGNEFIIEQILLYILTCDVLVGCNLAFINKGDIIRERAKILMNYLKRYAFLDMISLISVLFSFKVQNYIMFNNVWIQSLLCVNFYILRVSKIEKIIKRIQEFLHQNGSLKDMMSLGKVLVMVLLIGHIFACVWHGVSFYANDDQITWIKIYKYQDSDSPTRYNVSFYWAIMTMTTVGYGDIVPQNNIERLVCTTTMFVSCGVFAFSINSIGIVLQNLYKSTMEYSKSVSLIAKYMRKNKIPLQLQTRIRSYLEYIWQEEQEMNDEEVCVIVGKLSSYLQDELQNEIRGNVLLESKVIYQNFSPALLKKLVNMMEEIRYSPEEQIITIDQVDDNSLYLITQGQIDIVFEACNQSGDRFKKNTLKTLSKGEVFGEISFFTEQPRSASAFSKGFSKVFKIKREGFMHLLLQFPQDYEKFQYVRDSALHYNDYTQLKMKCYSCKRNNHLIQYCHVVHYKPDHERILKKENYPHYNPRRLKLRNCTKFNTRDNAKLVQKRLKDFQADFINEQALKQDSDMDEISFHSNLGAIQEAYEEGEFEDGEKLESEINSVLKTSEKTIPARSLRQIRLEDNDSTTQPDDLNNFFRNTGIKLTVNTAGFGMGESGRMNHQTTLAKEVLDESDEWSEDLSQKSHSKKMLKVHNQNNSSPSHKQIQNIPASVQNLQQSKAQVISPIYKAQKKRKVSSTDISIPYSRQISNKSQTYTSKIQQNLMVQQNQHISCKSEQEIIESNQDFRNRSMNKRKSTRTNTHFSHNIESSMQDCTVQYIFNNRRFHRDNL